MWFFCTFTHRGYPAGTNANDRSERNRSMMESYPFELGPIRPVDEGDSLLIRTTRGCPWNKCEFCVNYKDMRFSMRPLDEIKKDIVAAAAYYGSQPFQSCFLQDGDSFIREHGFYELWDDGRIFYIPSLTRSIT